MLDQSITGFDPSQTLGLTRIARAPRRLHGPKALHKSLSKVIQFGSQTH